MTRQRSESFPGGNSPSDAKLFQEGYREHLRDPLVVPRHLVEDLSLEDARWLRRHLWGALPLPTLPPSTLPDEYASPVQWAARVCAYVVTLSEPKQIHPQDTSQLVREVERLKKKGVPSAPLVHVVLRAAASHRWRELWSGKDKRVHHAEEEYKRLVRDVVESVRALLQRAQDVDRHKLYNTFQPNNIIAWLNSSSQELASLVVGMRKALATDLEYYGSQGRLLSALRESLALHTPKGGDRDGRYPDGIYAAVEATLGLVKRGQTRGALAATRRLFDTVGLPLTENSIRQARRRLARMSWVPPRSLGVSRGPAQKNR